MSDQPAVLIERQDAVALISFNRPERLNARFMALSQTSDAPSVMRRGDAGGDRPRRADPAGGSPGLFVSGRPITACPTARGRPLGPPAVASRTGSRT